MRAVLFASLLGIIMSQTTEPVPAQEKPKPKDPSKKESYDELVSVRFWDGTKFINAVERVPAYRIEKGGAVKIYTRAHPSRDGNPGKGSEIIDKDGATWVVEKVAKDGGVFNLCTVKKKTNG